MCRVRLDSLRCRAQGLARQVGQHGGYQPGRGEFHRRGGRWGGGRLSLKLAKFLVSRGLIAPDRMDDLLQHQLVFGGELDTCILELELLDEPTVARALGEFYGLPVAGDELISRWDPRVVNLLPVELATKYEVAPVCMTGRQLHILANKRPHPLAMEELEFLLSLQIRVHVVCEVRLRGLLHSWYGVELEPRYGSILSRLGPMGGKAEDAARESAEEAASEPIPAADEERIRKIIDRAEKAERLEQERRKMARAGRLPLNRALELAMEAQDRDELIDCILRFCRQFAEAIVLFVVGKHELLGWDAVGLDSPVDVKSVKVPVGASSVLNTALESRAPYLGEIADSIANRTLLADLKRPNPANVFVVPLVIRNRVVALIYGDDGNRPVRSAQLSPLMVFASRLPAAFERLILRMKKRLSEQAEPEQGGQVAHRLAESTALRGLGIEESYASRQRQGAQSTDPGNVPVGGEDPASQPERELPVTVEGGLEPFGGDQVKVVELDSDMSLPESPEDEGSIGDEAKAGTGALAGDGEKPIRSSAGGPVELKGVEDAIAGQEHAVQAPDGEEAEEKGSGRSEAAGERIDFTPDVDMLLHQLTGADRERAELAADALSTIGTDVLGRLMELFPGPLYVDYGRDEGYETPLRNHGPLVRCLMEMGPAVAETVAERLEDEDPRMRYYAVRLLAVHKKPELVKRVAKRLTDADPAVRLAAVDCLLRYRNTTEFEDLLDKLRRELEVGTEQQQALAAALLGNFADKQAVPILVGQLKSNEPMVRRSAHEVLCYITKQDFGRSRRKWLRWWEENKARNRLEWLIDALSSGNRQLRASAYRELVACTGERFGYDPNAGRRDRLQVQRRWRQWWSTRGRLLRLPEAAPPRYHAS
ncbi:MAG: hypothetical protein D6806_03780 [Deltaproteobacteria bacterium]|nr:MAG: hypothetical protein D6806_03780 [Deltaproteobacteria bacterium]